MNFAPGTLGGAQHLDFWFQFAKESQMYIPRLLLVESKSHRVIGAEVMGYGDRRGAEAAGAGLD